MTTEAHLHLGIGVKFLEREAALYRPGTMAGRVLPQLEIAMRPLRENGRDSHRLLRYDSNCR